MDPKQLQDDLDRGRRAQNAYDSYLKDHFMVIRTQLFNAFCNPEASLDELSNLKGLSMAIAGLETSIFADIENAKVAAKHLNELNN